MYPVRVNDLARFLWNDLLAQMERRKSDVVVQRELVGMGPQADCVNFLLAFVFHIVTQQLFGEHITF